MSVLLLGCTTGKNRWKLHRNAACCFEQILKAAPYQTAVVTSHQRRQARHAGVTWSTTERREIRNFPYLSVFELTGCQTLTVKNRNVGQFLTAGVTNPGQNESQQMFALCDWMDKEVGIWTYSSPNESPDRVKEEEAE